MKYLFFILFLLSILICQAQKNDTLLIKLSENNRVIGDVINKQYSVFDLRRHFKSKIDSIEYNFNNPNLMKSYSKLYLVSMGNNQSGTMLIALPAYVDSIPNSRFNLNEKRMHACISRIKGTICEFEFDKTGHIIGCATMQGFGKREDCIHKVFNNFPSSISNMYIYKKP
jgi:hypothetical protein